MSFAPLLSSRDGSSARSNSEPAVSAKRESRREPMSARRKAGCRVAPRTEEPLVVPPVADTVQHAHGLGLIRLVLRREALPIFLNPSLVLAVEDRSGGTPHVTGSLVTITTSRLSTGSGYPLSSPFLVRETAQQVMDAILGAEIAHPPGPSKILDRREDGGPPRFGADPSYPQVRRRGIAVTFLD